MSASPLPVTVLVTRTVLPEYDRPFQAWMRDGALLAAGFPGFLGAGVLAPPEGSREHQVVMRFADAASLARWESSLSRQMWLEHGREWAREGSVQRVSGLESWFGAATRNPPRWKQAVMIWLVFFPVSLLSAFLLGDPLKDWPIFWKVLLLTVLQTPLMVCCCIPLASRVLRPWLQREPRGLQRL